MTSLRDAIIVEKERTKRSFEPNRIAEISKAVMRAVDGAVEVVGRPNFVWVEEYEQHGGVSWVFNPYVQARDGLHVLVGPDPHNPYRRVVLSPDWDLEPVLEDYDGDPFLPLHAQTHEWPDFDPGADPVTVYPRAFGMLRTYAADDLEMDVSPLRYEYDGVVVEFGGQVGIDLSSHQPASGLARYVLVYLDVETNTIATAAGDTTVDAAPVRPPHPDIPIGCLPSALVRIDGDQTTIAETDILDIRMVFNRITGELASITGRVAALEAEVDVRFSRMALAVTRRINERIAALEAEIDVQISRELAG